jgi:nucleoid DNA-binding protein
MNKSEMVQSIAADSDLTKAQVGDTIDAFLAKVGNSLAERMMSV